MRGASRTLDLFGDEALPEGFRYRPDFLSKAAERTLLAQIKALPFREFEFHGFTGKRRIVSFGWRYDFNRGGLTKTEDIPKFLLGIRARAESFAAIALRGPSRTEWEHSIPGVENLRYSITFRNVLAGA